MRSRVSDVKTNFKGKYENFECEICLEENESQIHIINCKEINEQHENIEEIPKYEELFSNNVKSQIKIARRFTQNMKIRKKLINTIR